MIRFFGMGIPGINYKPLRLATVTGEDGESENLDICR